MLDRMAAAATAAMLVVCLGCASGGSSTSSRQPVDRDVILDSEISSRAAEAASALQVIQKLRPQMLRTRGRTSPSDSTGQASQPKVYVDNIEYGGLSYLENVPAIQIREIRFVNARDATTQWGTGHMGGVIVILTKK